MKQWECIIRDNFNHLDKENLEAVIAVFEAGLQNGHVLSLDKDYILRFCDDFCRYANLPKRAYTAREVKLSTNDAITIFNTF